VNAEDKRHAVQMRRRATVESHYGLRPADQLHHFAAVHVLCRERNSQQTQRTLHHQQGEDQDIRSGGGGTHARAEQTTFQQQQTAHQTQHAAGTAREHGHLLLHFDRQPGFIHPVRRQHPEEVAGKNTEDPQVEQVRRQVHPLAIQHLAGARAPGVLAVVVAQPASHQEHGARDVRVDVKEEHIQEVH